MSDPCHHCGLKVTRGGWHEGHDECIDELWGVVMFAGSKEEAVRTLHAYGDLRYQLGVAAGRSVRQSEDVPGAPD